MDVAERLLAAIKGRREDYEDTRENEAYISGLKEALAIAVGIDQAHQLLVTRGESYW